jgi:hypothetical protein
MDELSDLMNELKVLDRKTADLKKPKKRHPLPTYAMSMLGREVHVCGLLSHQRNHREGLSR